MEFTNAEKERINQLYGNDFEGITPDDAQLIARWEQYKAESEQANKAEIEALKAETEARLQSIREQHEIAVNTLYELRDKAYERLERVENGKA